MARAIEPRAVEIALRRVLRRRSIVQPSAFLIDRFDVDYIELARRDQLDRLAVARHYVGVTPSVAFAGPGEGTAFIEPLEVLRPEVHPGLVLLNQYRSGASGAHIREHNLDSVLQSI